jgi:hypothetical protein
LSELGEGFSLDADSIHQLRQDHDLLMNIVGGPSGRRFIAHGGSGGGSNGGKIWFRVIAIGYYTSAFRVVGCEYVRAVVTQVSCDASSVSVGDEVSVFDPMYCYFNLPITLLMQLSGTATLSKKSDLNLSRCGVDIPGCFWSVDGVCCLEEDYAS